MNCRVSSRRSFGSSRERTESQRWLDMDEQEFTARFPPEKDPRFKTLISFLSWATTQEEPLVLSARHESPAAINAMLRYLREVPHPGHPGAG
jgi:hypothetical protein